jgi:hypothetical protein
MQIPKHKHAAPLPPLALLDKLAALLIPPEGGPEGRLGVGLVMHAHDLADVEAGFAGVVEGDGGHEVVADVGADDVVEEVGVDEAEVAVDGCGGAAGEGPGCVAVVGHGGVGVLEEGDGHYMQMLEAEGEGLPRRQSPPEGQRSVTRDPG